MDSESAFEILQNVNNQDVHPCHSEGVNLASSSILSSISQFHTFKTLTTYFSLSFLVEKTRSKLIYYPVKKHTKLCIFFSFILIFQGLHKIKKNILFSLTQFLLYSMLLLGNSTYVNCALSGSSTLSIPKVPS